MFHDGLKPSDLGSRSHVLKHLHGRMIFGPFEREIHEGTLFRGHITVISFIITKKNLHLYHHRDHFYNQNIDKIDKTIILMMMVLG